MARDMRLDSPDLSRDFELQAIELEIQYLLDSRFDFSDIIQLFDCMIPYQGFVIETRGADAQQCKRIVISRRGWRS